MKSDVFGSLGLEFANTTLGDRRRTSRLMRILDDAIAAPDASLPNRVQCNADLEATYRFLSNQKITPEAVAEAHFHGTAQRAKAAGTVLVLHDTTDLTFGGETQRKGLGRTSGTEKYGFLAHFSICASLQGEPLGALGLYAWKRSDKSKGRRSQKKLQSDPDRESLRWFDAANAAGERLHGLANAVHVMDREGDCYELMSTLVEHDHSFIIRLCHDRRLDSDPRKKDVPKLFNALEHAPLILEREVILGGRGKQRSNRLLKTFPARDSRHTRLEVRAQSIPFFIGNGSPAHLPPSLHLNFVEVREANPPDGVEAVLWRLVTTECIDTPEHVALIVDAYRMRWLIEEFFKAIKTGSNYESLQLENAHGLLIALVLCSAVAWRLLRIRWIERKAPETPATDVLNNVQMTVLKAVRRKINRPLSAHPTVREVLLAIAALGGHLKHNGPPGWLILNRGFEKLLMYEVGWWIAQEKMV